MPLLKNGVEVEDGFASVGDDAALPDGAVIVSLARFLAERETLLGRNRPLGVRLAAEQSPEALAGDLDRLALVELHFAKFRDGRAFSWARMLRTRFGFAGEIRVSGDYLYDQIAFLRRVGVDAFVLPAGLTPALFARAAAEFSQVYQPSADGRATIAQLRQG